MCMVMGFVLGMIIGLIMSAVNKWERTSIVPGAMMLGGAAIGLLFDLVAMKERFWPYP